MDVDRRLVEVARRRFGWASLRPEQLAAMRAVLAGEDVLAVMPSGAGKSAIYELPTLVQGGLTLVVSPLIALQHDQVEAMGATLAARQLSGTGPAEQDEAFEAARRGEVRLLLLTPELLADPDRRAVVASLRPALVAVDEAHCVSAWGYDFRPDYLHLGVAIEQMGRPPVAALTATASPPVRADIISWLGMRDPLVIVAGLDRPNIHLDARQCPDEQTRLRRLREFVSTMDGVGIVYCPTRRTTQEQADLLRRDGVDAHPYHAGLPAAHRERLHDAFLEDRLRVMVSTSAFGMGIDHPGVRWICHTALTESPDSYYQEIGRAGRDGGPAVALLLHRPQDVALRRYFTAGMPDEATVAAVAARLRRGPVSRVRLAEELGLPRRRISQLLALLEQVRAATTGGRVVRAVPDGPGPADAARLVVEQARRHRTVQRSRIQMMEQYAETAQCRGRFLVGYFGEPMADPCGHCDNCDLGTAGRREVAGPFPIQSIVHHGQWGDGMVLSYEEDRMTILFDAVGYRTVALADAERLLSPARAKRRPA